MATFQSCDSIVFLAFAMSGGGPLSWRALIATYDWVNHDIPTADELEGALNRFLSIGLVVEVDGGFALPDAVRQEFEEYRTRRRKGRFALAEAFINRYTLPETVPQVLSLSTEQYENALADYYSTFSKVLSGRG